MAYTNSGLVTYTRLAPSSNHYGKRTHAIDRITPHCVATEWTVEQIGACFANPNRRASCNYGIGKDGRVCLICEEKTASGCSSNRPNDERAITIECSSASVTPYAFRPAVYKSLINLCADICRRNGKKKLLWLGSKEKALAYVPKSDEMVLTVHRWFANKSCCGDWLYARLGDLAAQVNKQLGSATETPHTDSKPAQTVKPTTPKKITKTIEATTPARKFNAGLSGFYTTKDDLNVRNGAGVRAKLLGTFPKGSTVRCYGYYNLYGIVKWYFVTGTVGTVQYIGYVNSKYLKKS